MTIEHEKQDDYVNAELVTLHFRNCFQIASGEL